MARGSRGRAAWEENGLRDYGNPHSVMGGCRVDDCHCDPLVEGKMVFDWVDNALVPTLDPSTCTPSCGPFDLYQTDLGSKPADALVGLQLSTSIRNRFFFVEHRAESTSGPAALVSWSDVRGNSGGTGTYGRSVLADCTPGTSSFTDAGCKPGGRIALDAGTAAAPRPITVVVGGVSGRKLAVYVSTNPQFEVPADTTTRPAPAATLTKAERVAARKAARIAARKAAREAARQNGE